MLKTIMGSVTAALLLALAACDGEDITPQGDIDPAGSLSEPAGPTDTGTPPPAGLDGLQ